MGTVVNRGDAIRLCNRLFKEDAAILQATNFIPSFWCHFLLIIKSNTNYYDIKLKRPKPNRSSATWWQKINKKAMAAQLKKKWAALQKSFQTDITMLHSSSNLRTILFSQMLFWQENSKSKVINLAVSRSLLKNICFHWCLVLTPLSWFTLLASVYPT